jgi:hypothetical protein
MDVLDQVSGPAGELLARVDSTMVNAGAAADHPVWPLLRRVGALPGDAVGAVAALRPEPLAVAEPALRPLRDAYGEAGATAGHAVTWSGPAAEAYVAQAAALATHLAGGSPPTPVGSAAASAGPSLAGGASATSAYAEVLAAWMTRSRRRLAHALATVLGSAQAVTVRTGDVAPLPPADVIGAAADIAVHVLAAVAHAYEEAEAIRAEWAERLAEIALPPVAPTGPAIGGTTTVGA